MNRMIDPTQAKIMIVNDMCDAMDLLVSGDCASRTAATREPSPRSRPFGRVSDYRKEGGQ